MHDNLLNTGWSCMKVVGEIRVTGRWAHLMLLPWASQWDGPGFHFAAGTFALADVGCSNCRPAVCHGGGPWALRCPDLERVIVFIASSYTPLHLSIS